jgi:hypothetical protein
VNAAHPPVVAEPDIEPQIENARQALADAESRARTARWRVEFARRDLDALLKACRIDPALINGGAK